MLVSYRRAQRARETRSVSRTANSYIKIFLQNRKKVGKIDPSESKNAVSGLRIPSMAIINRSYQFSPGVTSDSTFVTVRKKGFREVILKKGRKTRNRSSTTSVL